MTSDGCSENDTSEAGIENAESIKFCDDGGSVYRKIAGGTRMARGSWPQLSDGLKVGCHYSGWAPFS
jgi:hypothetical protein